MANKIKGISIEISGDTTKLQKSLNQLNAPINKLNNELKDLDKALKLDPKNTELLAQKQEVLGRNISATKDKLNQLKEAQAQMGDYNKLTDEQKASYNRLSLEIAKSEDALKKMNEELKNTSKIDLSKIQNGLKKVGEVALEVSKKLMQVSTAIGGALSSVVGLGVKSYASLEQNIGGIEKLFGDSAEKLIENSKKAYKTAGLSANQYMENATSFSASLLKGLEGDSEKAVIYTDRAIKDMSDNANTFGSSMEEVMNVYKALSKEQFSTLDNLRLGYSGTKKGMEQLIQDASTYTDIQEELGITVDASSMSFDNMINAISVVQKHLNITGTTMKEAEGTITGSINQMKASFDNFLNGSGSPEELSKSIMNVLKNVSNAIKQLAPSILKGIVSLIKDLVPEVVKILFELIPELLASISEMIDELLTLLTENTESVQKAITSLINTIVEFITLNLPKILQIALQLVITLAKGIADSLPTLIPTIVDCVITICDIIVENLPLVIEAGIEIIVALIEGLSSDDGIEKLIEYIPTLVIAVANAIIKSIPIIIEAIPKIFDAIIGMATKNSIRTIELGKSLIKWIIDGLLSFLSNLGKEAGKIIDTVKDALKSLPNEALNWGKDMVDGFIKGLKSKLGAVGESAKKLGEKVKEFLHFSKPDRGPLREYEEWMPDFVEGLARTMKNSSGVLESATLDLANDMSNSLLTNTSNALRGLKSGVEASINPTINPNISYDLNYLMMASAMKRALEECPVILDDREVGRFVDKTVSEEVYQ